MGSGSTTPDPFTLKAFTAAGLWSYEFQHLLLKSTLLLGHGLSIPARFISDLRPAPAFHFFLCLNAVTVPIKGNAVVHAAVTYRGLFEKFAGLLVDHAGPRPAAGHEPDDAAVATAAPSCLPFKTFEVCVLAATFIGAHGCKSIVNRRRRGFLPRVG
jgi:hypothetical protein